MATLKEARQLLDGVDAQITELSAFKYLLAQCPDDIATMFKLKQITALDVLAFFASGIMHDEAEQRDEAYAEAIAERARRNKHAQQEHDKHKQRFSELTEEFDSIMSSGVTIH